MNSKNKLLEEFERCRRLYLGPRIEASEPVRRQYLAIMRRFIDFCSTEATPRAQRISEIKQDHYAQQVRAWQREGKSEDAQVRESWILKTFCEQAGLDIEINPAARRKNPKADPQ